MSIALKKTKIEAVETSNNSGLPEGWALTSLGDLSTYVTSGSRDWSKYYADHGALFIRTQDINENVLG
jgi:type I restriction enzyme, S subunit